MRWKSLVLLVAPVVWGCGGDDKPGLDGDWAAMVDSACGYAMEVKSAEQTYNWAFACALKGGGIGADLESGDLDLTVPGKITFRPRKASCSTTASPDPVTVPYELSGNSLSLTFSSTLIQFERSTEDDSAVVIRLGCWSEDRLFTESPIQDL